MAEGALVFAVACVFLSIGLLAFGTTPVIALILDGRFPILVRHMDMITKAPSSSQDLRNPLPSLVEAGRLVSRGSIMPKKIAPEIRPEERQKPDFYIFTNDLQVKHPGDASARPTVLATASSDAIDLEGDRFTNEALKQMQKGFAGKLVFLNHQYKVPTDVFGQITKAKLVPRDGRIDLDIEVGVEEANPAAKMTYDMIKNGTRLGVSVGVLVRKVETTDEDTEMSRDGKVLNITSVLPLEVSICGIPANQTAWVQQAVKSLFARGEIDTKVAGERSWIDDEPDPEPEVDMTKPKDTVPAVAKTDEEEQQAAETPAEEAAETPAEEAAEGAEGPGDDDGPKVDPVEVAEEVEEATVPVGEPAPGSGEGEGDHGDGGAAAAEELGGAEADNIGGPEKAAPGMAHPDNCPGCPDCNGDMGAGAGDKAVEEVDSESDAHFASTWAEWDTAYKNNLPDSAFAVVSAGGKKDESGKTVPRSLRHLPHHSQGGAIDIPHLRNALSREPQTDIPPADHAKAKAHLARHASAEGIGDGKMLDEIVEAFDALTKALLKQIEENKTLKEENERHVAAFAQVDKVLEAIGDMSLGAVTTNKEAFAESLAELFPMLHPDIRERMARHQKR